MLDMLLNQIKQAIFNSPNTAHQQGNDPDGLIGQIEGMFGQHQQQYPGGVAPGQPLPNQGGFGNVLPASQDPLGDPADRERGGYANAGSGGGYAPLNDPRQQFPNVRPASEDPLGDPADSEPRRY